MRSEKLPAGAHPVAILQDGEAWSWQVSCVNGAILTGPAPSPGVARRSGEFVAANLQALERIGLRRF